MRTPDALFAGEMSEHGDGLDRFTQAHLIGEHTVQFLLVHLHQPVQADQLVLAQLSLQQERHFGLNGGRGEGVAFRLQRLSAGGDVGDLHRWSGLLLGSLCLWVRGW